MSILYIQLDCNIITKTIYYTINVISMEAELFAIRCRINQVVQILDISHIMIITNSIYLAK